jgi:heavy metal sensor kinase
MKVHLRPTYIRTRLTLRYVAVFALVLALYIAGACVLQYRQLSAQLYRSEIQDLETVEGLLYVAPDGRLLLRDDYFSHPQSRLLLDRLMEVVDSGGNVLFRNKRLHGVSLGGPPLPREWSLGYFARSLKLADGRHVLCISHIHLLGGKPLLLRVAYSTDPLRALLFEFLTLLLLAMPLALITAGFAGYRIAGHALNPLEEMARQTERITASRLSERIPVGNPLDELGHMAHVLNDLLGRLEDSFEKLKRFTSDVSHELRSPLASIRSVGEVSLERSHSQAEFRDIIGSMLEEVARLTSTVDTLLTMAHADSGAIALQRSVFSLMELVEESVGVIGVLAEEKKQSISLSGDGRISVLADRAFLRMAVFNLLDNAIKYAPAASTIRLNVLAAKPGAGAPRFAEFAIEDEGPGIPEHQRQRIFDRFYRVDEARAGDTGGAGLGLAIAKWAIEAHGGEIGVKSGPARGSVFIIRLPAA